ncbi:MAG TPA: hypothetical protein VN429_09015 [Methanospirillum sp.]|uniref:hypothetical protein n=1 Tax=Methanospirillum sp. TaxID=45200 RepID=UPI002BFD3B51|nr:hypothetical protein [Methanospirillum sp.]HWQ64543.1 hypothetical protein [Methanospirillum sp.]
MFKRITELFKSKKAEPKASTTTLADLPVWLDAEEQTCISLRSEQFIDSREVIEKARQDILQLLAEFGKEDSTPEPMHPKVEQVNRHNLPQFKHKVEDALDVEFSDDDEAYYQQVAELINSCFKAYRGPGRYLHHLYADEVKVFRQLMDQIGKELNLLTEAIKNSRIRLNRIDAVREGIKQVQGAEDELAEINTIRKEMDEKRSERVRRKDDLSHDRDVYASSHEYQEYADALAAFEDEKRRSLELFETLDALVRTALPIWRRALRIVQDEKRKGEDKHLDGLIQMATLQQYADPEFVHLVKTTSEEIFKSIASDAIPLKNSFEKSLFVNADSYVDQMTGAVALWRNAEEKCQHDHDILASHAAAEKHSSFETAILDLEREIKHIDEESGKLEGRVHHLEREKEKAASIINDEMKELSGGEIIVAGIAGEGV